MDDGKCLENVESPIIPLSENIAVSNASLKKLTSNIVSPSNSISSEFSIVSDSVGDDSRSSSLFYSGLKGSDINISDDNVHVKDLKDFEDFLSSDSEYKPSSNESTSSSDLELSSDERHATKKIKSYVGKTKPLHLKTKSKSIFPNIETSMKIQENQATTSKKLEKLGQKRKLSSEVINPKQIILSEDRANNNQNFLKTLTILEHNQQYVRKSSARERPTICPICYKDVITHFTRHLFRYHGENKDVIEIKNREPRSKERLAMVNALRKQGYFHLKVEKNILNPVRNSKLPGTEYYICPYCLGHYSKRLLHKHVKQCTNKPADVQNPGKNCLSKSQTFIASVMSKNHEFFRKSRIKKEVLDIMRADDISATAKNDPLICLFGETLLAKHKRQQIANVVSNRLRELARMLIVIKTMEKNVRSFFDVLRPDMFQILIFAAKEVSGYDVNKKEFRAPSLALHMSTNLKILCDVAFKIVVEKRNLSNISWTNNSEKKNEIKELKKLIDAHWCNELASLALKNIKERQWEKTKHLPLASDILALQNYINELSTDSYEKLTENIDIKANYKILVECVLAQTVIFNRKRVGEVQFLKVETYMKENSRLDQEAFTESLTTVEKIISKQFKRVVTGGKGSKSIPILFSKRTQKYMNCLLKIRDTTDLVAKSNPYIFATPGSKKWISGSSVIRRLAAKCGAKHPELLTSTRFRKHIATALQLMSMEPQEMEQVATFMGHTEKTHAQFYRLPQDIFQTAKVAKVLLLLEKGKGKEFKGRSLNEINVEEDAYISEFSDYENKNDEKPAESSVTHVTDISQTADTNNGKTASVNYKEGPDLQLEHNEVKSQEPPERNKSCNNLSSQKKSREKWPDHEKKLVLEYFKSHLKRTSTPKKHECEAFVAKYRNIITITDWVKIKTLVYNTFRLK